MKVNEKRSKQWVEVIREKNCWRIVCIAFVHARHLYFISYNTIHFPFSLIFFIFMMLSSLVVYRPIFHEQCRG